MKDFQIDSETRRYILDSCKALNEGDPVQLIRKAVEYYLDHVDWRGVGW